MGTLVIDPDVSEAEDLFEDDPEVAFAYQQDDSSDDTTPAEEGVTAVEALSDPFAQIARADLKRFEAPVVDLTHMRIGGKKLNTDVINATLDAEVSRTIDGASTFTLVLADPDGVYRKSELFARDVDCTIDGHDYRLANVSKQGTQLVLTFETLGIALLRTRKGFKRAWRRTHKGGKGMSRAEFVLSLVREVKHPKIPVTIPELHANRPVGKFAHSRKKRDLSKQPGLSSDLKIKGATARKDQLHNLEIALAEADALKAQDKAKLAMICSGIGESGWKDVMNGNKSSVEHYKNTGEGRGSGYGGVLQGDVSVNYHIGFFWNMTPDKRTRQQAKFFILGGHGYQGGGAKALAKAHPDWTPGQIADRIEGGGAGGGFYQAHIKEAKAILKDWKSGGSGSTVTYTRVKKFAFERLKGENSWDAIQRLAQEDSGGSDSAGNPLPLGWRAFFVGNRFYWISEQHLFQSRSYMTISEDSPGVDNIDYEYDRGHPVSELTVTCRARFWAAPPGSVVTVKDMGIQVDGKWLVYTITRKRGDLNTTITLHKPQKEEPEPAPATEDSTMQVPGSTSSKKAAKGGIYKDANLGRIDQGIDFSGKGNMIALADGIITRAASSGTGWPGGTMIVEKLDEPVKIGKRTYRYIYYAENIVVKCKKGQRVSAGDVIGHARGVYPFTETGWAADAMGTTYSRNHEGYTEGEQTKSGKDFASWLGFGPEDGYAYQQR